MPCRTKELQREYQRRWVADRRRKWFAENGPCVCCGSWENLELHHKDPAQKVSHSIWSWSWERISEEVKKCEIRCKECHRGEHNEEMKKPDNHGTLWQYRHYGCRCEKCVVAQREYFRNLRNILKERQCKL